MIKAIISIIVLVALLLSYKQLTAQFDSQLKITNAYVSGKVIKLKSSTAGRISNIYFKKGQWVERGDLLFDFDAQAIDIETGLLTLQLRGAINDQLQQCLDATVMQQQIALSESMLDYHKSRKIRLEKLANTKLLAQEQMIDIDQDINQETLNLAVLKARYSAQTLGQQLPLKERAKVGMAINQLQNAAYRKHLHQQYAATDGYVYDVLTYQGQKVDEDTTLMVFLPKNKLLIEANVLESNLHHLKLGKTVDVLLDSAINEPALQGVVRSIVPATAASFSVLPRNNTDSNWIKVAQRVPVLIEVNDTSNKLYPIGTSVGVLVSTDIDTNTTSSPSIDAEDVAPVNFDWKRRFNDQLDGIMRQELAMIAITQYKSCQIAL